MATVALLSLVLSNIFRRFIQTIFGYIEESVDDRIVCVVGSLAVVFGFTLFYGGATSSKHPRMARRAPSCTLCQTAVSSACTLAGT